MGAEIEGTLRTNKDISSPDSVSTFTMVVPSFCCVTKSTLLPIHFVLQPQESYNSHCGMAHESIMMLANIYTSSFNFRHVFF